MNYAVQHLAHLVLVKNELNRKRRRFYYLMHPRGRWIAGDRRYSHPRNKPNHKSFPKTYVRNMYREACTEMRALTKQMRELRKAGGILINWGTCWNITKLYHLGEKRFIQLDEIARLADLYQADKILLGE